MSYYIGLLSGTSIDSIDAGLVIIEGDNIQFVDAISHSFPNKLKSQIETLVQSQQISLKEFSEIDIQLAHEFSIATSKLVEKNNLSPEQIKAIGSHGQTVFHHPIGELKNTIQLGSPHSIAAKTGIAVVSNFRNMDMALDGQGAPLAPILHEKLFSSSNENIAVINLGGISNITFLGKDYPQILGYDTGPANCLIDSWISLHKQKSYDQKGAWAKSGTLNKTLLNQMLDDDYFKMSFPKSTGREYFNLEWFNNFKDEFKVTSALDIQTTLTHLTAKSISLEIEKQNQKVDKIIAMGGGANNDFLLELINQYSKTTVQTSMDFGFDPNWIESILFAYLAHLRINKSKIDLKSITGSYKKHLVGDVIYPP